MLGMRYDTERSLHDGEGGPGREVVVVVVEGWISDGEDAYYRGGARGDETKEGTQAVPL